MAAELPSFEDFGFTNICADCTDGRFWLKRMLDVSSLPDCEESKDSHRVNCLLHIATIDEKAEARDCPSIEKQLPDSSVPVPELCTTELCDYRNLCLMKNELAN
jgi:hypothetical protein